MDQITQTTHALEAAVIFLSIDWMRILAQIITNVWNPVEGLNREMPSLPWMSMGKYIFSYYLYEKVKDSFKLKDEGRPNAHQ